MKKIYAPLVIMLVACFAAYSQPKATVYTNDFNGISAELAPGKYDNKTLLQSGIAVVRSVKVPAGMQVTLFMNDNFEGTSLVLLQDANKKLLEGKGFGMIVQRVSLMVEKAPAAVLNEPVVTIYKDNFSGASLTLRAGYYDHFELGNITNDNLSSVKVPKGMKVTLYEHGGYTGRTLVLTQDASAPYLVQNKFNDITSSLFVEVVPEPVVAPEPVKETPPVVIVIERPAQPDILKERREELEEILPEEATDVYARPVVTLFEGNFSGRSKKLSVGRFSAQQLGIADNSLSSVKVTPGLVVTLYDQPDFKGKSFIIKGENTSAADLAAFNDLTSSVVVAFEPMVIVYSENFSGSQNFIQPGHYTMGEFKIGNDELSSLKITPGMWVLLFEHDNFTGRSLLLTEDASEDFMKGKEFNNATSSLIIGSASTPQPVVTLFDNDRTTPLKKLTPGEYPVLDAANDKVSSVEIPHGLKVTLFENAGYEGRSITITESVSSTFLKQYGFDNFTSSVKVEQRNPDELIVKIYSGSYRGFVQKLTPGKYYAYDLELGTDGLSSLRIPQGLKVQLFTNGDLTGATTTVERDTDFSGKQAFDNTYSSMIITEQNLPVISEVSEPEAVEEIPVITEEVIIKTYELPTYQDTTPQPDTELKCKLDEPDYQEALKAIKSKSFKDEKMDMVMRVTKNKCLTNEQIRSIAKLFNFEDQSLTFIKQAYDQALEKDTYYKLEDVFTFSSSKTAFNKFLKEKGN